MCAAGCRIFRRPFDTYSTTPPVGFEAGPVVALPMVSTSRPPLREAVFRDMLVTVELARRTGR
ncbi:hypothetical protein C0Q99_31435 [Streptomyces albidoflavus]|nr:hypothetical protein C0Q99_31435 [Streptomyces albidoflavus]